MRLRLHLITLPIQEKGEGGDLNASNNFFFNVYCFLLQNVKLYLWPDWLTMSFRNVNRVKRDNTEFWLKSQCSLIVLNFYILSLNLNGGNVQYYEKDVRISGKKQHLPLKFILKTYGLDNITWREKKKKNQGLHPVHQTWKLIVVFVII